MACRRLASAEDLLVAPCQQPFACQTCSSTPPTRQRNNANKGDDDLHTPSTAAKELHRTALPVVTMLPRINIPPVTRILLITLGLQSILSAAIRYKQWSANSDIIIPYLNLIPQLSLIYPWTFLTTTLVESNIFNLSIAALTLYHGGRYLERAWSSREFAKFLLVTALVPNIFCFGIMIMLFTFTRNESWTYVCYALPIPPPFLPTTGFT